MPLANFQIERSKAPAPAPALDMFAEEDQKTTDGHQENVGQEGQDSVGKIHFPHKVNMKLMSLSYVN